MKQIYLIQRRVNNGIIKLQETNLFLSNSQHNVLYILKNNENKNLKQKENSCFKFLFPLNNCKSWVTVLLRMNIWALFFMHKILKQKNKLSKHFHMESIYNN